MLRVLVRRISTPGGDVHEGDTFRPERFGLSDDVVSWLLDAGKAEEAEDDDGDDDEIPCPVDDCEYSGTERGLSQHTRRSHADDGEES